MKLSGRWKRLGCSVYESSNGDRVHTLGTLRVGGKTITISSCELVKLERYCLRLMGFNNKRALMLMCEKLNK